ncbi:MAG TPA: hypothetical protein VGR91_16110 [Stellaceae bacterium]|nr:hypothetical protein [Stellaceae bacterium]
MKGPPSFGAIKAKLEIRAKEGSVVVMSYEKLCALIRVFLDFVEVDEEWYKATYPDAARVIASGIFPSAKEHFIEHGYFEARLPHDVEVDEAWYYHAYPDVAATFERGGPSAKEHFIEHGYREGRNRVRPASAAATMGTSHLERPLSPAAR